MPVRRIVVLDFDGSVAVGDEPVLPTCCGDAGKPGGMPAVLDRLLSGLPPAALLSVGDVWRNDLERWWSA